MSLKNRDPIFHFNVYTGKDPIVCEYNIIVLPGTVQLVFCSKSHEKENNKEQLVYKRFNW